MKPDVIFVHAPSIYDFREKPIMFGPVSDVVPSTPVFEMYPIGFAVLSDYLEKRGFRVRILNLAMRMLKDKKFNVEECIRKLDANVFALDLHWLPHAQGALEVAKIIKRQHPDTPVLFGGLSATYYQQELIRYPQVDMIMKGDSTEEPVRLLLEALRKKGNLDGIPNLTWKDKGGTVHCQPISYVPDIWNHSRINYGHIIKSVLRDRDLNGYLPFKDFVRYPIVAAFFCRGGFRDCSICGGSRFSYKTFFGRKSPAIREPETLAFDIYDASRYFSGPIFIVGDIQSGGQEYVDLFLNALKNYKVKNMIVFEFWKPPSKEVFEKISRAISNWSFEISCESQDDFVRNKFGKAIYTNEKLKECIVNGLKAGAERADVYFLTGIPFQTKESIMGISDYVKYLYENLNGHRHKLLCFVAPLAPFVDPGSLAFEKPQYFGYRIVKKTLDEHRKAIQAPSWKYWLNYESEFIDRDTMVQATYDAALALNKVKLEVGAVSQDTAKRVERNILKAKEIIAKIDEIYNLNIPEDLKMKKYHGLKEEMRYYSMSTVCEKRELEWNVSTLRKFKIRGIIRALLS